MFYLRVIKTLGASPPGNAAHYEDDVQIRLKQGIKHLDDTTWVACCRMKALGLWEFEVGGLGREKWPATIFDDLMAVAHYLPEVAAQIERGIPTKLHFYEMNVNELVHFTPQGADWVKVQLSDEDPQKAAFCVQPLAPLVAQIREAFKVYFEAVEQYCPEINQNNLWKDFITRPEVQRCFR